VNEGYVPRNFVRFIHDDEGVGEDELDGIEEEEEEEYEEDESDDYEEEEDEDEEDSDESEASTSNSNSAPKSKTPTLPDDMIDVIKQQKLAQLRRRSSVRVPKGVKLLEPDVLEGLEGLPKGFRASTLAKNADQGRSFFL
jgi:hypothetical protein